METPSELLIRCIEDFGDSEATVAIVIYRQANGDISWRVTGESNTTEVIGMLDCAHAVMLHNFVNQQYQPPTPPDV
jgi:hypothetical protein